VIFDAAVLDVPFVACARDVASHWLCFESRYLHCVKLHYATLIFRIRMAQVPSCPGS